MGALKGRKATFAQHFAVSGNATKAALAAGYKNGRGIWKTAWRLANDANICREVARLREISLRPIRKRISDELYSTVLSALNSGTNFPRVHRAQRLLARLGVYEYANKLSVEIEQLEERYGAPIETIIDAMAIAEAGIQLDNLFTNEEKGQGMDGPSAAEASPSDL